MSLPLRIKLVDPSARVPVYSTAEAAGCDFYSLDDLVIHPNSHAEVRTGVCVEIPPGYFMELRVRSGMARKGIINRGGTIDSDYRGEISALLYNLGAEPYQIKRGDRVIQGLIQPVFQASFQVVDDLSETIRGVRGFGSTGR